MSFQEIKRNNTPKNTMKQFSTLPSCFLTPESAEKPQHFGRITPTQDQTSSVFLSPPSSLERKSVPNFAFPSSGDPLKLELDFDECSKINPSSGSSLLISPLLPGRTIDRINVDFITELLELNGNEICKSICGYLSDRELSRFASVCTGWRMFIKNESRVRDRLDYYLFQRQKYCLSKGKENLGSPTSVKLDNHTSAQNAKRTPLVDINVNKVPSKGRTSNRVVNLTDLKQETPSVTSASENFRPCPKCSSPSNYAKVLGSHCWCHRCGLEFCSMCLKDTKSHKERMCRGLENPQEKMETKSKTRRKGKDVVCSRKNKERMRRL